MEKTQVACARSSPAHITQTRCNGRNHLLTVLQREASQPPLDTNSTAGRPGPGRAGGIQTPLGCRDSMRHDQFRENQGIFQCFLEHVSIHVWFPPQRQGLGTPEPERPKFCAGWRTRGCTSLVLFDIRVLVPQGSGPQDLSCESPMVSELRHPCYLTLCHKIH